MGKISKIEYIVTIENNNNNNVKRVTITYSKVVAYCDNYS